MESGHCPNKEGSGLGWTFQKEIAEQSLRFLSTKADPGRLRALTSLLLSNAWELIQGQDT